MPVLVNPNRPMTMEDFAGIYTANGVSPKDNASDLFFNAPTEGRSYMDSQWSKFNTGSSPEDFFSDPSRVAAILASSPSGGGGASRRAIAPTVDPLGRIAVSGGNTGHEQWPMYSSESARQTAMALGMDQRGSYTTPTKMVEAVAQHVKGVSGDHLLDDPELQKLMAVDPEKAKFIYEKVSGGRSFDKDRAELDTLRRSNQLGELSQQRAFKMKSIEEQLKFQRMPMEFGIKTVQDLISRGAHFDPNSGELSTWQYVEPDQSTVLGGDNRPVRKRMPATPEEKHIWEKFYPFAMGMPAPQAQKPDPAVQAARQSVLGEDTDMQGKINSALKQAEGIRGGPLNADQIRAVVAKVQSENKPLFAMPGEDSRYADFSTSFLSGIMGKQGWQPGMSPEQTSALPQNAWGRFADKYIAPIQRKLTGMDFTPEEIAEMQRKHPLPPDWKKNRIGGESGGVPDWLLPFVSSGR